LTNRPTNLTLWKAVYKIVRFVLIFHKYLEQNIIFTVNYKMPEMTSKRKFVWINNPQYKYNFLSLQKHEKLFNSSKLVFVSSCSEDMSSFFSHKHFQKIRIAKEAVLNMSSDHFSDKSIMQLVKRGMRHGTVKEICYTQENAKKVEKFKKVSTHGKEPQLRYLFLDKFKENSRLFVFENEGGIWLGAISISYSNEKIYTHLILRRKNAPVGIMEALIFSIYQELKKEGFNVWSLGDVPFVIYDSKFPSKEFFVNFIGRRLKFAYNFSGLYNFKNKFKPQWNDVYICCKPKFNFNSMLTISLISNLFLLVVTKLIDKIFLLN
jgi:glycosyltransferase 2 family protein